MIGPTTARRPAAAKIGIGIAIALSSALVGGARAYDPATTQAGLVQKAALASELHRILVTQFGHSLGLLEPLRLRRDSKATAVSLLWNRLDALDPGEGYRPNRDGVASALNWLSAGAVLAETPPERGRNHFFDPTTGRGLDDARGLTGTWHSLRLAIDGAAGIRQIAAGTAFDLTGEPSTTWLNSSANDLSVGEFVAWTAKAGLLPSALERAEATAHALLCAGAIAAVVTDAGDPAHVRNDFRRAFSRERDIGSWDERSAYETFVARTFGRQGVPDPGGKVNRPHLAAFISAPDGEGLADRTARRFFSDGTVPEDVLVDPRSTPRDVVRQARLSLAYPAPPVGRLDLRLPGRTRYLTIDGRKTLAYQRRPERIRFFLDQAVHAESAAVLLPEIGGYLVGLFDHLFRARVGLVLADEQIQVTVTGLLGALAAGAVTVLAEDRSGKRTPVGAAVSLPIGQAPSVVSVPIPAGAVKVAVVVRGTDGAGAFVALGEHPVP